MLKQRVHFAILVVIGTFILGCTNSNSQLAPTPPAPSLTGQYSASVIADMRSCQLSGVFLGHMVPGMGYAGTGPLNQDGSRVSVNWSATLSQLGLSGTLTKDGVLAFTLETFTFSPYLGTIKIAGSGTARVQPDGRIVGTLQGEAVNNYSGQVNTCRSDEHTVELRRRS